MGYVIEEVTPEVEKKIFNDASYDQRRVNGLKARGGWFNNAFDLKWAVDREKDSYILSAMRLPMTNNSRYYFYFKKHLYILIVDALVSNNEFVSSGYFDEEVDESIRGDLEQEVRLAYLAYGPYGEGQEYREPLDLTITYKGEK